ncbi:helix-turn-helix domain-containing protein [Nonomuraea sp. NPDC048826]|uniref:helix-turn-helix domain-containing protein n=1 Tax=Nonomuraea sp. NPDC048826 TaxID=3364347 RepID=UPI003714D071
MSGGTEEDRRASGALLRRWRERALLTQEDVAERSGLSVRTVRRLERDGLPRARSTSLRLLGEALGLDRAERARIAALARGSGRVLGPETRDGLARAHDALVQAEHACRDGRRALRVLIADAPAPAREGFPDEAG